MFKKARDFMKMAGSIGFGIIVDVIPNHINYTLREFVAIQVLASYYCHTNLTLIAIAKTMMGKYPKAVRRDKVFMGEIDDFVASWFSMCVLQHVNEIAQSEADLKKAVDYVFQELLTPESSLL